MTDNPTDPGPADAPTPPDHEGPPPVSLILEETMRPLLAAYVEIGKLPLPRQTFECIGPVHSKPVIAGGYAYFVIRGQRRGGKVEHHGIRCDPNLVTSLRLGNRIECVGYSYRPDPEREPIQVNSKKELIGIDTHGHAFLVRRISGGDSLIARKDSWWVWCYAALLVDSGLETGVK